MRTFIFLFCSTVFSFSSGDVFSQNVKVQIDSNKTITIDEVFNIIKQQTDFNFIYKSDMFKDYPKVNVKKGNISANKLLEQSLSKGNFNIDISGKQTIIISENSNVEALAEITVKGQVVDKNGLSIPGITVYVTNQKPQGQDVNRDFIVRGTTTDIDGNFSLVAEVGYYLVASGMGYEVFVQAVTNQTVYKIVLKERISALDEVLVVGYGTKSREEISSAISSIQSEDIAKNIIGQTSFDRSLSGLVKGVNVRATSGTPGAGIDINIRGNTSPFSGSDNNPLFVIDGVPFQANPVANRGDDTTFTTIQNPLLSINPNDIESMDVLKDAAATSIYGSRGANGVIIVNTKKGKRNQKASISYSTSVTMSEPIKQEDFLNASEWKEHVDTYFTNTFNAIPSGIVGAATVSGFSDMVNIGPGSTYGGLKDEYFGSGNTNWGDEVYRSAAYTQKHNLSIRGGNNKSSYSVSGGYTDQEGLIKKDVFKQYNLRLGLDNTLSKTFTTGTNLNLNYSKRAYGSAGFDGFRGNVLNARPDIPVFNEDGTPSRLVGSYFGFPSVLASPYATSTLQNNTTKAYNVLGNVYVKANINEHLSVKADVNGSFASTDSYLYTPNTVVGFEIPLFGIFPSSDSSFAYDSHATNINLTTDLTANYTNSFGKHNVNGLIGYSWARFSRESTFTFLQGFPDDIVLTNASNANSASTDSSILESGLNSFFGRASYNYNSKYFVTMTLRSDKSSKFAPGNQEAFFPSIAASWNIAREPFLENSSVINHLRLRASAGETGSTNLGSYDYLQGFRRGSRERGLYVGNGAIGLTNRLANDNASWETTAEVNAGLDFRILNNRLRGSVDIYNRKTTGALVGTPIPLEGGLSTFTSNFIDMTNRGFEFEIGGDIIKTDDFTWATSINISQNKNKIDKLTAAFTENAGSSFVVGKEISLIRGYIVEGIFQNEGEINNLNASAPSGAYSTIGQVVPGDYRYADINGDNEITIEDSYAILGSAQPDFFGGFNSTIAYKGFELAAFFNFSSGAETSLASDLLSGGINPDPRINIPRRFSAENRWSPTNTDATLAQLVYRGGNDVNVRPSSVNIYDASFIRLKNIQLTYNLPTNIVKRIGMANASVFISGTNLVTWDKNFPGLDPENTSTTSATFGGYNYPNSKSLSMGINLNF
ncbi:SusC/RagA family TonB-linked outer membrane protein [Mariniflexile sp. AS56]|uniref:SusC/RagA family TonB-linked outer membrane protein n=1 Tax=Mariniflexile sp. AS56 TaxID=3063957 RepID=UPI0026F24BE5|nr:TonB-dependent receptor [Mariniflexile sp. AS56]MDO7171555.1 TonB-dependent receptor [Mariniflexile sp. AS56]